MSQLLRYQISSLRQLPNCLSNNSKKLHIQVSDFINQSTVTGFRVSVEHEEFGTLFAYLANADGYIVSKQDAELLPLSTLLAILEQYGFYVEFDPSKHMDGNQLQYLTNLRNFGYDKIRSIGVYPKSPSNVAKHYIVAFKAAGKLTSKWILTNYATNESEFTKALVSGEAMNLTNQASFNTFIWDWLTYVANIDDILRDNVGDGLWT